MNMYSRRDLERILNGHAVTLAANRAIIPEDQVTRAYFAGQETLLIAFGEDVGLEAERDGERLRLRARDDDVDPRLLRG